MRRQPLIAASVLTSRSDLVSAFECETGNDFGLARNVAALPSR